MHNKAMEMAKWVMDKACSCGYDNLNSQDWDDFKDCMEIAEKAIKADYYYKLIECINKDEEERRFYNNYHYEDGHFAPTGTGIYRTMRQNTKGYIETITPEKRDRFDDHKMYYPEYLRDLDRNDGRMYYPDKIDSRYDLAVHNYSKAKDMYKDNTPEENERNMKNLGELLNIFDEDVIKKLSPKMSPAEKNMAAQKLDAWSKTLKQ